MLHHFFHCIQNTQTFKTHVQLQFEYINDATVTIKLHKATSSMQKFENDCENKLCLKRNTTKVLIGKSFTFTNRSSKYVKSIEKLCFF